MDNWTNKVGWHGVGLLCFKCLDRELVFGNPTCDPEVLLLARRQARVQVDQSRRGSRRAAAMLWVGGRVCCNARLASALRYLPALDSVARPTMGSGQLTRAESPRAKVGAGCAESGVRRMGR